jgi:hypothetical protein
MKLLDAVRRPLDRIMARGRLRNPLGAVAYWPGEEPADRAALTAAARESVVASREDMADDVIDPLRDEALQAVDVLDTAWRPLCGRRAAPIPTASAPQAEAVATEASAAPASDAAAAYTLGDLLRDLEASDHAYARNKAVADRKAATSSALAKWWYVQIDGSRWQPDPRRMPGIERIELICNRLYGTGVTAESVRRLRAKLCDDHGLRLPRVADQLDLITATQILDGVNVVSFEEMEKLLQYNLHHGLTSLGQINVGGGSVQVTGLSCKVIAGTTPTACPDANPPVPPSVLPAIDKAIRRLNKLPPGTTVHWVGHDTGYRSRCRCHPDAPYTAPFDEHRWGQVVPTGPAEAMNESSVADMFEAGRPGVGDTAEGDKTPSRPNPIPDVLPDGPFDPDGFRYHGGEVRFGRAGKQRGLVLALWDQQNFCPLPARLIQDVITEVYGEDNDTTDPAFRQLCSDTQRKLDAGNVPLTIQNLQGKVQLVERPR